MPDLCYLCLAAPKAVKVSGYNITVCQQCWSKSANGWPEAFEAGLFDALQRGGLLIPDRTPQGRLPRHYSPPADYHL